MDFCEHQRQLSGTERRLCQSSDTWGYVEHFKLNSSVRSTEKKSTPCWQSALHETDVTPMLSGKDGYMAWAEKFHFNSISY